MYQQNGRVRFVISRTGDYEMIERSRDYNKILGSKKQIREMLRNTQSNQELAKETNNG
jgi:hypothetical protein